MSRGARLGLIALALGVAALAWAWSRIEWVEREIDGGWSEAALRNPFLAAEQLLERQGIEVETVVGLSLFDALPRTEAAIVLVAPRESLSARRRAALIEWVEGGGTLLVVAHSVYDFEREASADPLLDALGVFLVADEADDEDEGSGEIPTAGAPTAEPGASEEGQAASGPDEAGDSPATIGELITAFGETPRCREDPDRIDRVAIGDGYGIEARLELSGSARLQVDEADLEGTYFSRDAQMLALPVGEGVVVALTSFAPFANARIHCQDHAWFLWYALEGRPKAWMIHDPDPPSIGRLAARAFPTTLAAAALWIVLFGAAHSLRFGVVPPPEDAPRREHLEHLEASARFRDRHGDLAGLERRVAEALRAQGPRNAAAWSRRAGVPQEAARATLDGAEAGRRRGLRERVATLARLRRTR